MPYLRRPSGLRGIWNVADFHLCVTPFALNRFIHAHLALSLGSTRRWFVFAQKGGSRIVEVTRPIAPTIAPDNTAGRNRSSICRYDLHVAQLLDFWDGP
jgi:hypothetical protein